MKKINEFFQGNVVEKVEVRKINRNSGRNILDLSKQEKTGNTLKTIETAEKKNSLQKKDMELSTEEKEKIKENIDKIDKKI